MCCRQCGHSNLNSLMAFPLSYCLIPCKPLRSPKAEFSQLAESALACASPPILPRLKRLAVCYETVQSCPQADHLWVAKSPSQPKKRPSEQARWCDNRTKLPVEYSVYSRRPSSRRISMGEGQGCAPRAESWVSCWNCLRPPAADTNEANLRPRVSRLPFRGRATAPVAGWDGQGPGIDAGGLRGNKPRTAQESGTPAGQLQVLSGSGRSCGPEHGE
jgi:hypothetical protein